MSHRIGARGILIGPNNTILLALEQVIPGIDEFWVPPGGGLELSDGSTVQCLRREFQEETGLTIDVGALVYVREFSELSRQTHHLALYFLVQNPRGELHETDPSEPPCGDDLRRHVRWFTQEELQTLRFYPEVLRDRFWQDRDSGVTGVQYLGTAQED